MSEILTSGGQKREMQCINEPGLWKLIFRSNKPIAKELTRWVTHEVLQKPIGSGAVLSVENIAFA